MKANAQRAVAGGDAADLAKAFDQMVAFAPPGYTNWVSISNDGSNAAKAGKVDAAKTACRTCHDQYKKRYQAEMRDRKI